MPTPAPGAARAARLASYAHAASALGAAPLVFAALMDADGLAGWAAFWGLLLALAALGPWAPQAALGAWFAALYGTPRYGAAYEVLWGSGLAHALAGLALASAVLWAWRERRRPRPGGALLGIALLWFGWVGTTWVVAGAPAYPAELPVAHHPLTFLHALLGLVLAAATLASRAAALHLSLTLALALLVRALAEGGVGLDREGDIALLTVLVLPLVAGWAWARGAAWMRVTAGLLAAALVATLLATRNRAAVVGLAAALLVVWTHGRPRWRLLGALVSVLALVAGLTLQPGYWQRLRAVWAPEQAASGMDVATVRERVGLWRAGWRMALDHPVFGVGPGQFPVRLPEYAERTHSPLAAHSNYLQAAADTGLPGLAIYAALFLGAVGLAHRVGRRGAGSGVGVQGVALEAALVAYLGAGLFVTRYDLVLAYVLVGWVVALRAVAGPRPGQARPP